MIALDNVLPLFAGLSLVGEPQNACVLGARRSLLAARPQPRLREFAATVSFS
jgi:hypothetical protein